jgi:putative hydrolase of the HAD superfamily
MTAMAIRALLFDIGEVVTTEQWHLLDQVERTTGRTLIGRGPLDPTGDPVWQRYLGGELSFTDYWAEYALANGYGDWRSLFRDLPFETDAAGGDPNGFVHPEAARLIRDARSAGLRIGALTNDGVGINGMQFFLSIPLLAEFEVFADAQEFGGKPERRSATRPRTGRDHLRRRHAVLRRRRPRRRHAGRAGRPDGSRGRVRRGPSASRHR